MADASSLALALGGFTRRQNPYDLRRAQGEALLKMGSDASPILSPWQGAARLAQALTGGIDIAMANQDEKAQNQATIDSLSKLAAAPDQASFNTALQGLSGTTNSDVVAPILAQVVGQRQQQIQRGINADAFGAANGVPAATPAPPSAGNAIASTESGGQPNNGYGAVGPVATPQGNRAYGRYQVLDSNVGPWTQEVLGKAMTPQEFLANPQAQDKVFETKFGQYVTQYGSPQAASRAWFAGPQGMNNPNATDVNGMTPQRYEQKFNQNGGGGIVPIPNATGVATPTPIPNTKAGDAQAIPAQMPSATSGPPDVPRPQPTAGQITKYKGLIASGALTPAQAVQELDKEITGQWTQARQQALEVWKDQQQSKRLQETGEQKLNMEAPLQAIQARVQNYENKIRPTATAAVNDLNSIHQVRQVLDAGAFTGTGANAKTYLGKLGEQLGIPSDQVQNTQVLGAILAKRVLAGAGGSLGTGFSNADRDFMERAQGGQLTMDEGAIRRILDIGEKQDRQAIKNHDQEAARIQALPGMAQLGAQQFQLPPAPTYDEFNKANPLQPLQTGPAPAAASQGGDVLAQARDAIARGAPRDAVIKRLQGMGVSPEGL